MSGLDPRLRNGLLALSIIPAAWLCRHFVGLIVSNNGSDQVSLDRSLRVFVKTSNNRTIPLILRQEWTVSDIKAQLAAILGLEDSNSLGIILAGRELNNDVRVSDCDLGQQTILHAVQVVQKSKPRPPLNEDLVDLQLTGEERLKERALKAHFFVYCKECDKILQPGKLRVRCFTCKEGSILMHRDPCGWSDVLDTPGTIEGHCLNEKCTDKDRPAPAEFFFKCNNDQDHQAPPLYQIRFNIHEVPCLACTEVIETVLVFECEDKHVICLECFGVYVKSRLSERQFVADKNLGYTIGCPVGCENSLVSEHKHILVMLDDPDDYDR